MKPEPRPSTELLVKVETTGKQSWIDMWPMSQDAKIFVMDSAPKFGKLFSFELPWALFVYPTFDVQEVAGYLNSYND